MGPLVWGLWLQMVTNQSQACIQTPAQTSLEYKRLHSAVRVHYGHRLQTANINFFNPPPYTLPMQSMVQLLDWTGIFRDHILYPCNLVTLSIKGCTQHWEFIPVTDSRLLTSIFLTLLLSSLPPLQFWNHFETWTTISNYFSVLCSGW